MTESSPSKTAPHRARDAEPSAGDERRERSAAALRANLKRRKAQSRDRQTQVEDGGSTPPKADL